ncbi:MULTISPECIES: BREX-1 system phosphatase PglZ type B [unclassified Wenzhouxiangella]|uniref:BREX-1 system phosphatase PglZ type B n=1 Tax=unclassified Wenzhouxiangella TaxID=2613841 RepID=UPI000E32B45D|nr:MULTISPECIES: BREX-1 system phosphatase PglZ type B [unclassified Wenzhouxiangella]RFF27205.1 BREX-1 system phosphatase PglZ type B [Wenzhouxiangella sp. 15181]RFP69108.1 BREX-1 system phosphatase PglZ type B [Wenzhouxiangella sp. 15190]
MPSDSLDTLLDALCSQLSGCASTPDAVEAPAAILWTDPEGFWRSLVPQLLEILPELLVLGEYDPERRTGPAVWLRCVVDGGISLDAETEGRTPILYLPGVGRQDLRRGDEVPWKLSPLVELQFRGTMWLNKGQDWTVTAFLSSSRTLDLELGRHETTRQALLRALPELAVTSISSLKGRRLTADDFDRLLSSDTIRDLLRWMGEPELTQTRMGRETWAAFCSQVQEKFGLDPATDDVTTAGELLGRADGAWESVWERFAEAPQAYKGIPELLARSQPNELLLDGSRWPGVNRDREEELRKELEALADLPHAEACERLLELERKHGGRRGWVWAALDQSPMAKVLTPLATVAQFCQQVPTAQSPDELAGKYVDGLWQADQAAWQAMVISGVTDDQVVHAALRALLEPWLESTARLLQELTHDHPLPLAGEQELVAVAPGECLVFVDGLRFDIGMSLVDRLRDEGCEAEVRHRWSALPSVTATGKPAVTPAAKGIRGAELGEDFAPNFVDGEKSVVARNLRADLETRGYQILSDEDASSPADDHTRGWLETANIDKLGHKLEADLARQLPSELERLANRIRKLFDAGWKKVRIVTDHGWLLLPGGLPKAHLPKHLTQSRWARCAAISGASEPDAPTAPWYWNREARFAYAPGISCFNAAPAYAHGGVSLQECVIPDIAVTRDSAVGQPDVRLESISWHGLRCFIEAASAGGNVTADLRLGRVNGVSVANTPKKLDEEGTASLLLPDDEHEDADLVVVLLDEDEQVLAHKHTKVGHAG